MRSKWWWLVAGSCLLQWTNCAGLGVETAWRVVFDLVFLPINQAIVTFL